MSSPLPVSHLDRDAWPRPRTPLARVRLALLLSLIVLTGVAWAVTLRQAQVMSMPMGIAAPVEMGGDMADMADMADMGESAMATTPGMGWSVAGAGAFVAIWTVMMAAMMLPAAAPLLLLFATTQAGRGRASIVPTWLFAAGYLLVWAAVGLAVYILVQSGGDVVARLTPEQRASWAPLALGTVLIAAGLYQFTPLKRVCLTHCRSPLGFIMEHWREGRLGALRMGLRHGAYCLGCCWALFAILVATGIMSVAWMLLLTLVVFAEKVLPVGRHASQVVGVAFVVLGVVVAVGAADLPWVV